MKRIPKMLAPYFAVGVFWCVFSNAWLAILAYHLQIIFWLRRLPVLSLPNSRRMLFYAIPAVAAGPLLYLLLPLITRTSITIWLADYNLSGLSLLFMIPYFGLVHPYLEQLHWTRLRNSTPLAHPLFAGYHMIVLYSLLTISWLFVSFLLLNAVSYAWHQATQRTGSSFVAVLSHTLADLSIIIAAALMA
ncbi:MAG: hypothetical protein U9P42_09760 [Candidatus Fermentibacteria bacterium]|nr:hypothetical protein [Candidatus Fermentibacteria bacterium]